MKLTSGEIGIFVAIAVCVVIILAVLWLLAEPVLRMDIRNEQGEVVDTQQVEGVEKIAEEDTSNLRHHYAIQSNVYCSAEN